MISTMNNLPALRFAPFLDHTKPIPSVAGQNLSIFDLYNPSKILSGSASSASNSAWSHPLSKSWTSSFWGLRVLELILRLRLHENAHRSCTQSVSLVRIGRPFEHVALRHLFSEILMLELRIFFNADAIMTSSIS